VLSLNPDGTIAVTASVMYSAAGMYPYQVTLSDDRIDPGAGDANVVGAAYGSVEVTD
jgi:hypothetical protein